MRIKIREGNTGILYITKDCGAEERYIPDYDLKESNRLLLEFYKLQSNDGKSIKDCFWKDGINWFPTTIALLHWHILYMYVKYKSFFERYPIEGYTYIFLNKGRLFSFVSLISLYSSGNLGGLRSCLRLLKKRFVLLLRKLHNKKILRKYPEKSLIFFSYGIKDFRTQYAKKILDDLRIEYVECAPLGPYQFFGNFILRKPLPILVPFQEISARDKKIFCISSGLPLLLKKVFHVAVYRIQDQIYDFQVTYSVLKEQLKDTQITKLYGIDDTNHVYPIIYACQANGIKTIGHQHGANYSPWDAPYSLQGFKQGEYKWFDTILVWGEFWKKHILSTSTCYTTEQIKVGTSLRPPHRPKSLDTCGIRGTKNILIPYEFLADTYLIGRYICALQDLGYIIYLKWRKDERLEDEIEAYCLNEEREKKLIIVEDITNELMDKIDIVAASYSTIIFESLPYLKVIWILETKFVFREYLVEKGIAKKIRLEHLEEDIQRPISRVIDQKLVDFVFSRDPLSSVLMREIS